MPRGATPDPNKPTINLSVSLCDLEIGKAPGRALKIKKLKDADFATLPPASLDILPGQTLAITFQIRAGVPVDHVAVIVASTAQNGQDGDSRYRGACVAVVR